MQKIKGRKGLAEAWSIREISETGRRGVKKDNDKVSASQEGGREGSRKENKASRKRRQPEVTRGTDPGQHHPAIEDGWGELIDPEGIQEPQGQQWVAQRMAIYYQFNLLTCKNYPYHMYSRHECNVCYHSHPSTSSNIMQKISRNARTVEEKRVLHSKKRIWVFKTRT